MTNLDLPNFELFALVLATLTLVSILAIAAALTAYFNHRAMSRLANRCITLSESAAFSGVNFLCFARYLKRARSLYYRGDIEAAHKVLDDLDDLIHEHNKTRIKSKP
ncbi:hypothetical protein vBVhaSVHB1_107 [Vibrio phage vB_VhaS-VHB1]|nr:hypothetical protein vBVhaSVHB1_107 [Vibrio phage vB_VhaS-VHB1]